MKTEIRRAIASVLVVTVTSTGLTPAWAETIGTESALASDRERILVVLDRAEVRGALEERGVSAEEAKARIAALTDAEAAELAQQIDAAPAGARNPVLIVLLPVYLIIGAAYLVAMLIAGVVSLASKGGSQGDHASKVVQADFQ